MVPSCPVAQLSRRPVVLSPICPVVQLASPSFANPVCVRVCLFPCLCLCLCVSVYHVFSHIWCYAGIDRIHWLLIYCVYCPPTCPPTRSFNVSEESCMYPSINIFENIFANMVRVRYFRSAFATSGPRSLIQIRVH